MCNFLDDKRDLFILVVNEYFNEENKRIVPNQTASLQSDLELYCLRIIFLLESFGSGLQRVNGTYYAPQ